MRDYRIHFIFQFQIEWKIRYDSSNAIRMNHFQFLLICHILYRVCGRIRVTDKNQLVSRLGEQIMNSTKQYI